MNEKTCKDCLHYKVCQFHIDEETTMTTYECDNFTDSSEWVHLPCKAGDMVFCFAPCFDEIRHPKLKIVEAEIIEVRTIATVLGLNFDVDKIGKTVFLTREEAEKALAERKEK